MRDEKIVRRGATTRIRMTAGFAAMALCSVLLVSSAGAVEYFYEGNGCDSSRQIEVTGSAPATAEPGDVIALENVFVGYGPYGTEHFEDVVFRIHAPVGTSGDDFTFEIPGTISLPPRFTTGPYSGGAFVVTGSPGDVIGFDDFTADGVAVYEPGGPVGYYFECSAVAGQEAFATTLIVNPPDVQISEILALYDEVVASGEITAVNGGGHINSYRNLLENAADQIDKDKTAQACKKLGDAVVRADGSTGPSDWVQGPGTADLLEDINLLRSHMGCT